MTIAFTPEQQSAIEFCSTADKQHLVIEAGAGSGKTQVLCARVQWLLKNANPPFLPSQILVLTFTTAARDELKERLQDVLQSEGEAPVYVTTIDSFFASLVEDIYPHWWEEKKIERMPPRICLADELSLQQKIETCVLNFFHTHPFSEKELGAILDFILSGGLKDSLHFGTFQNILKILTQDVFLSTDPNRIRLTAQNVHPATGLLIGYLYGIARSEYEKRIQHGELSYADKTIFLQENIQHPPLSFQELIVDEYQDTNAIQHTILLRLVKLNGARMIVVGDPKQSIYGFRGASVDIFKYLTDDPSWNKITLNKNFRSQKSLLDEINLLSELSFSWQNPTYPKDYLNSFFYTQAQKKQVGQNPLIAGKTTDESNTAEPCVWMVCASLGSSYKDIKLEHVLAASMAKFLREWRSNRNIPWNEIAILCETNKQIKWLKRILTEHGIPVLTDAEESHQNEIHMENHVGLSLVKYLAQKHDLHDLYFILQSPLSPFSQSEIESYFIGLNVKKNTTSNTQECPVTDFLRTVLEPHQSLAQANFFYAWQTLRWKLVFHHLDAPNKQQEALLFCIRMDGFAKVLKRQLSFESTRTAIENGANTPHAFVLETDLTRWRIEKKSPVITYQSDAISIQTVHKAKGLQWPYVCFFPKQSRRTPPGEFILAQSENFIDISWLNQDVEKLSKVTRVKNQKFFEKDHCIQDEEPVWFQNLRKYSEEEFERQRIFYTAFTRAEKNLILFQFEPTHQSKKSAVQLSQEMEKKKTPFLDSLEKDVYAKYIALKRPQLHVVEYAGEELNLALHAIQNETENINPVMDATQLTPAQPILTPSEETAPTRPHFSSLPAELSKHVQNRKHVHFGLQFHTKMENAKPKSPFLQKLKKHALFAKHEFEVWQYDVNIKRNIIDLLLLFKKEDFSNHLGSLFPHHKPYLCLIVDFKTGKENEKHIQQMQQYRKLAEHLLATPPFQIQSLTPLNTDIVCALFYTSPKEKVLFFTE